LKPLASQKCRPFNADFNRGEQVKTAGASSGEYESCSSIVTFFFVKKSFDQNRPVVWSIVLKEQPSVGSHIFLSTYF